MSPLHCRVDNLIGPMLANHYYHFAAAAAAAANYLANFVRISGFDSSLRRPPKRWNLCLNHDKNCYSSPESRSPAHDAAGSADGGHWRARSNHCTAPAVVAGLSDRRASWPLRC